jgi:hypothetical protein
MGVPFLGQAGKVQVCSLINRQLDSKHDDSREVLLQRLKHALKATHVFRQNQSLVPLNQLVNLKGH